MIASARRRTIDYFRRAKIANGKFTLLSIDIDAQLKTTADLKQ